jgi:hypothetical protein
VSSFGPSEQTAAYPKMSTPRAYGGGASSATRSPMIVPRGAAAPRDIDAPFVNSKLQRGRRGNREYARWRVTQGQGTDHHSPVPAHPRSGRLADPNALGPGILSKNYLAYAFRQSASSSKCCERCHRWWRKECKVTARRPAQVRPWRRPACDTNCRLQSSAASSSLHSFYCT